MNQLIQALGPSDSNNDNKDDNDNDDDVSIDKVHIATVLSSLCYLLGKSILSDRPRLERCSTGTNSNHTYTSMNRNNSNNLGSSGNNHGEWITLN